MVLAFFIFNYHTMKKINEQKIRHALKGFATAVCLLTASNAVQAQIQLKNFNIISSDFTNTKRPQIAEIDEEESIVRIYDETFTLTKTFNYPKNIRSRQVIEERTHIPGEYTEKITNESHASIADLEEAILIANAAGLETHTKNDNVHTFVPLEINIPGATDWVTYTKIIYREDNSVLTRQEIIRLPKYSEWKAIEEDIEYAGLTGTNTFMVNERGDEHSISLTQNIFNPDEKFEFFFKTYEMEENPRINTIDRIWFNNEEFVTKRSLRYEGRETGTKVMNEDGNVLFTLPAGLHYYFFLLGEKYHIGVYEQDKNRYSVYTIDQLTSSVRQTPATTESMKFYPRMARRSDNITIETGRAATGTRLEVIVTTANGRVVERHSIPAGETRTQISASHLSAGMYNFTVYANGQRVDNGKIIIR